MESHKIKKELHYKIKYIVPVLIMQLMLCLGGMNLTIEASEDTGNIEENENGYNQMSAGTMMVAVKATELREEPDADSNVIVNLEKGQTLLVTKVDSDGWCEVFYQGKTAYASSNALEEQDVKQDELDKELLRIAEEDKAYIESLEMQRKAAKQARIWGGVIIVLIIAVFTVGIISVLKNSKRENQKAEAPVGLGGKDTLSHDQNTRRK